MFPIFVSLCTHVTKRVDKIRPSATRDHHHAHSSAGNKSTFIQENSLHVSFVERLNKFSTNALKCDKYTQNWKKNGWNEKSEKEYHKTKQWKIPTSSIKPQNENKCDMGETTQWP